MSFFPFVDDFFLPLSFFIILVLSVFFFLLQQFASLFFQLFRVHTQITFKQIIFELSATNTFSLLCITTNLHKEAIVRMQIMRATTIFFWFFLSGYDDQKKCFFAMKNELHSFFSIGWWCLSMILMLNEELAEKKRSFQFMWAYIMVNDDAWFKLNI